MYNTLFIAVVCIVQLTAANEQRRFVGRAEPMEIPHGWKPVSSAPLDEYVKLTFALKQVAYFLEDHHLHVVEQRGSLFQNILGHY